MNKDRIKTFSLAALGIAVIVLYISLHKARTQPVVARIAVIQNKAQEWADALKLGFEDGLRDAGLDIGEDVLLIHLSAAGDPQGLTGLVRAVARQEYRLVYALGTQAAQEVFAEVDNKPIVFGAVTDPVKAGFCNGSLDKPLKDLTGTQDLWPYPAQFDLMQALVPGLKRLGIIYNSSEINSQVSVGFIQRECNGRGIELLERAVTEDAQVLLAVNGLIADHVDVVFIPADNTAQSASQVIIGACMRVKIPVFTGISGIVEHGALGTVGTNYYELGRVNAEQVAAILSGTAARDVPIRIADRGDIYLNLITAKKLGLSVPEAIRREAFKLYE